jgi:methylated-DNA-[protein]-cysteine S-methyltransferase
LSALNFVAAPPPLSSSVEPAAAQAIVLLQDYFGDAATAIPLLQPPRGTPFQRRVWHLLQQIPVGEARRYGEIASVLGSSARAVAGACRANPLPILIPCHRVVAATGLGGYMGEIDGGALEIKRWLLHHEGYV